MQDVPTFSSVVLMIALCLGIKSLQLRGADSDKLLCVQVIQKRIIELKTSTGEERKFAEESELPRINYAIEVDCE